MTGILKRLYRIARANSLKGIDSLLDKWERNPTRPEEETFSDAEPESFYDQTNARPSEPDVPPQIREDLANFNLLPPSSLSEVRKARNREMKKYHPDLHGRDSEKMETAKKIIQIYNASYERLKAHYEAQTG